MKKYKKILSKKFLKKKYNITKNNATQIAKEVGCSKYVIYYWLKKYNIKIRTSGESNKGRKPNSGSFKKGTVPWIKGKKGILKRSEKVKKRLSEARIGEKNAMYGVHLYREKNGNWQGGKSFEPYPLGWTNTFKEQIRYRDGYKCQICGCPEVECNRKLDVHHKDYNKMNINPKNLISLCKSCHMKTNGNREYWKEYFQTKVGDKNEIKR